MVLDWLGIVLAIILVDLTLSGDNALVIGAAASKLQGRQRTQAIAFGGVMAIILRIALAFGASLLLQVPFVKLIAGVLVFWIGLQLIRDISETSEPVEAPESPKTRFRVGDNSKFFNACLTIVVADVTMSTDNVLAIAVLSHGNIIVLAAGLLLSITILLLASAVVAKVIERLPFLMYLAGGVLAFTSGSMIAEDPVVKPLVQQIGTVITGVSTDLIVQLGFLALFLVIVIIMTLVQGRRTTPGTPLTQH